MHIIYGGGIVASSLQHVVIRQNVSIVANLYTVYSSRRSVQYKGGFLPDIILLILCDCFSCETRLDPMWGY